jgi:hypothetical protein
MPYGKEKRMNYETPSVTDFGDLVELTQGSGQIGATDGTGFTVQINVGPTNLSIGVLP